ncbi:MAG: hypothetical protein ACTHN0_08745 [Aquihabitans sp.]
MAYTPMIRYQRTDAERADPALSWRRTDRAFFASGACHILAFAFRERHPDRDLSIRYLRPGAGFRGTHLYVVDGGWALDFDGWNPEQELLDVTEAAYRAAYPGWTYEVTTIDGDVDLEAFCAGGVHRAPRFYAHDPLPRARAYLARLPVHPPSA